MGFILTVCVILLIIKGIDIILDIISFLLDHWLLTLIIIIILFI